MTATRSRIVVSRTQHAAIDARRRSIPGDSTQLIGEPMRSGRQQQTRSMPALPRKAPGTT